MKPPLFKETERMSMILIIVIILQHWCDIFHDIFNCSHLIHNCHSKNIEKFIKIHLILFLCNYIINTNFKINL